MIFLQGFAANDETKKTMDNNVTDKVIKYVEGIFEEKYDKRSTYHSLDHTREVAEAAEKIGKNSNLNDEEMEAVIIAAWFHDTGYLFQHDDHESHSVKIAEEFLKSIQYPEDKLKRVIDCILATRMNIIPNNLMEEVIHDADYINLANPDNFRQSTLLRLEAVNYGGKEPTEDEWLAAELEFLVNHRYYTEYARNKLQKKKSENIKKIQKKLKKYRKYEALILKKEDVSEKEKSKPEESKDKSAKAEEKEIKEEKKAEEKEVKEIKKEEAVSIKGFETIYKLSSTNHMRLNAIADRKANIMLTLNGIIISITISIVATDPDNNVRLIVPTSILILVCLATIVFATLSTRPKITKGTITKEDIENKKANLLFFGNFSRMDFKDFDWGIRKMIRDQEYLHNSMIEDFYNLGKVLDAKFKYLRICYNVFMYGIMAAVASIAIIVALGH